MKKFSGIILVLLIGLGWACHSDKEGYVLTGNLNEKPGEKVLLKRQIDLEKWIDSDSTTVDRKGDFEFRGSLQYPEFVYVYLTDRNKFIRFFLENNQIRILKRYDSILFQPYVEGSATQDTFRNFRGAIQKRFNAPMHQLNLRFQKATNENDTVAVKNILRKRDSLISAQKDYEKQFIVSHANSILAPFMISISYMNYSVDELDSLMDVLDPALDSSLYVKIATKRIRYRKMSQPGNPAPELNLPDTTGSMFTMNNWNGRYLLLNFWASWNQRSISLSKQLLPVYEHYHDLGLDIVGIALDTKLPDWKAAVKKNHFPWIQLIESSGPRGDIPAKYNITGFPMMILIDPEGIIQARIKDISELEEVLLSIFE